MAAHVQDYMPKRCPETYDVQCASKPASDIVDRMKFAQAAAVVQPARLYRNFRSKMLMGGRGDEACQWQSLSQSHKRRR